MLIVSHLIEIKPPHVCPSLTYITIIIIPYLQLVENDTYWRKIMISIIEKPISNTNYGIYSICAAPSNSTAVRHYSSVLSLF